MIAPMPVQDIHAGREAFQRDLQLVLKDSTLTDRGWLQPDDLTLLVPMMAENTHQGEVDLYLLRLHFDHYPKGPPSAQFVNPLTMKYAFPDDVRWVPKCESLPDIHFHTNYGGSSGQVVCSSSTLEFYKVSHDVKPEHVWDPARMNFMVTLAAIRRGLASANYRGRSIAMNDETLLWRPLPPSAYVPTGKVLTVPAQTLVRTAAVLRTARMVESSCLWLGELDQHGNGEVKALVSPAQVNRPKNYSVPGSAMLAVAALARTHGWTVVGAIHSHPGVGVEHSTYDDEMTPSRRAVSIVVPCYGNWSGTWPLGFGVHEYYEKYWHQLSDEHARLRVVLSDSPEGQIFDLR